MRKVILTATCDGAGAATVNGSANIMGKLFAIAYLPGTIANGATIVVTTEGVMSKPLLTKATAGTSDTVFYPREIMHAVADGSALTATTGSDRGLPLVNGTPRLVVSAGGASGKGSAILYYED